MFSSNKPSVFIIGENHNAPAAKLFIADNVAFLKESGFGRLLLEGVEPESIPHLKKNPADTTNTLESYQALYRECRNHNIGLEYTEDLLARFMIDNANVESCDEGLVELREDKFVEDTISQSGNAILLVGGGHVSGLVKKFQEKGLTATAMLLGPPGTEEAVKIFAEQVLPAVLLYQYVGLKTSDTLVDALIHKMQNETKDVTSKMKENKEAAYPSARERLCDLHDRILSCFSRLSDKSFQLNFSILEYIIGSLYQREGDKEKAIEYTQSYLERGRECGMEVKRLRAAEDKLTKLREEIHSSSASPVRPGRS